MISDLKRFLLILAMVMPLAPLGFAQQADQAEQEEETEEAGVTDYVPMDPAFVTHIGEPGPALVYLKAAVTLRTSRASTREALETHMPRLRHELVMLFGEQTDIKALAGSAGQSELRAAARQRINQVLEEQQTGEEIADVLFTEFVVQR